MQLFVGVLRYKRVCLCDPGPLIYQRPHLSSTFLLSYDGRCAPSLPTPQKMALFGRSLMLMSRPGLGLRAVNRELMRLVVCLCTVVTRLKDGPLSGATGQLPGPVKVPSQALTQWPCRLPRVPLQSSLSSIPAHHACEEFDNA